MPIVFSPLKLKLMFPIGVATDVIHDKDHSKIVGVVLVSDVPKFPCIFNLGYSAGLRLERSTGDSLNPSVFPGKSDSGINCQRLVVA